MEEVLSELQNAQTELDPQFKALRQAMGALRVAIRLASEDKADALPMQRALVKLETAAFAVENESLDSAVSAFAAATGTALNNLAFEFASDLREAFEARGERVEGRPPVLTVGKLIFNINIAGRKGQWFYGKEALTRPIPLSLKGILKAYDQQVKRIVNRTINSSKLTEELYTAWQDCLTKRKNRPASGRINIVETFSQLILNRQSNRFWNAPSRRTFKDYDRALFVRDLVILQEQDAAKPSVGGQQHYFRLGVATKSQVGQASRSIWLPENGTDGQYYSDITFDK
ncbi:MAG: hypothetical protein GWP61_14060 [Chloroflexi bacterium]|jgi:hypothetical protein|nr:hypothetical protein [Chloroflexota bacterium]